MGGFGPFGFAMQAPFYNPYTTGPMTGGRGMTAMQFPVGITPEVQKLLGGMGIQAPDIRENMLFSNRFAGIHPQLARSLEAAVLGGAMTPGPQGVEAFGTGLQRAMSGIMGVPQARRQFQIMQMMAPFQMAEDIQQLRATQQQQRVSEAMMEELKARGQWYGSRKEIETAHDEAREAVAEANRRAREDVAAAQTSSKKQIAELNRQLQEERDLPAEAKLFQFAQKQGFKGTFPQWMKDYGRRTPEQMLYEREALRQEGESRKQWADTQRGIYTSMLVNPKNPSHEQQLKWMSAGIPMDEWSGQAAKENAPIQQAFSRYIRSKTYKQGLLDFSQWQHFYPEKKGMALDPDTAQNLLNMFDNDTKMARQAAADMGYDLSK